MPDSPLSKLLHTVTWACQAAECGHHGPNCRPSLPAPLLALAWDDLSMHAHVAEERLQRLTVSLAGCAAQRAVQAAPADSPSTSEQRLEEASPQCLPSDACMDLHSVDHRL